MDGEYVLHLRWGLAGWRHRHLLRVELRVKRELDLAQPFRLPLCRRTYPQGVALGCYPGALSARWTLAANLNFPQPTARRSEAKPRSAET